MNIQKDKIANQHIKVLIENSSFESMLADLSSKLVNLPLESIDAAIESSLKSIVEFFEADRCNLGTFSDDKTKFVLSYFYSRPGINIPPITGIGEDFLPFIYKSIKEDKLLAFTKITEFPNNASHDKAVIEKMGIKSLLVLPLKIDNAIDFGLSLSTVRKHQEWKKHTIYQIKIVGNILANVMHRKIALKRIVEEKEWSEAVMQGMPQLTYVLDLQGRLKRWNKNLEDLFGYTAEELQDKFLGDFLNEEDLKKVMVEIQKLIEDGQERSVKYDIIIKGGKIVPSYYGSGKLVEIGGESFIVGQTVDISEMKLAQKKIEEQLEEIKVLKEQLEVENIYLRQELMNSNSSSEIIGQSDSLKHIFYRADQVAALDTTVLLEGETGTGKELFARYLHQKSKRKDKPFIMVNCASLPATLIESELFGHEKGAFTDAIQKQIGRFELADGGTLFLDEIGEIPIELQSKLLRVLQEGEFERIGNPRTIKVNARVITATNRVLEEEVQKGLFREDLYYRLNVFPITITPLRKRVSDIPLLVEYFVRRFNQKIGKNITNIPKKVMEQLKTYNWPGNIRELENIIERAMILSHSSTLSMEPIPSTKNVTKKKLQSLEDHERDYITKVLEQTLWRINGPKGAALILDMHPETLRSRIKKLGIKHPKHS